MDAVYRPKRTELLERVAAWGGSVLSGDGWFLGQAWLQHLMIFRQAYGQVGLEPGVDSDLREHVREGMGAAFEWWGGLVDRAGVPCVLGLVGLRGAGKTTVGRKVAEELGARWLDLDDEVAKEAGLESAAEVIERDGLRRFRLRETAALAVAINRAKQEMGRTGRPTVVSTGGGIVESERAVELLVRDAWTAWLRAPMGVLVRRVAADSASLGGAGGARGVRPAIVPGAAAGSVEEFESLRARRAPTFDRIADVVIDVAEVSAADAAREVCRTWNLAR